MNNLQKKNAFIWDLAYTRLAKYFLIFEIQLPSHLSSEASKIL